MAQRQTVHLHSMAPDLIPEDVSGEYWNRAVNCVFRNGETVAAGNDLAVMASATIVPWTMVYVEPFDQGYWVYADKTAIKVSDGTNETDITPVDWAVGQVTEPVFTSCVTNGLAVINSSSRAPVYWDGILTNVCQPLPDWPVGGTCNAMRAHKNFLMAVGMTSEGGQRLRWSTAAEAGTIPDSWTPLASNQAGFLDLAPLSSSCLDGLSMRDDFMVYKRETIWRMVFVGGNDIFAVQKAFAEQGCAATNAVGRGPNDEHLFLTSAGDMAVTDGVQVTSILSGKAQRTFYADFQNGQGSVFSVFNLNREKLGGVIYPGGGDTLGTTMVLFDYESADISFRQVANTRCAAIGRYLEDVGDQNEWDGDPRAWDSDNTAWNQQVTAQTVEDVLLGTTEGIKLFGGDPVALPVSMEKSSLPLDQSKQYRRMISRIWPKVVGDTGDIIKVRLGGQESAGGPTTLNPDVNYVIGSGLPIDAFIQGRYLTIMLSSTDTSPWRWGSFDIEHRRVGGF